VVSIRISSGLRVLAVHDHARWDQGLVFVGGGLERPDARWGAVWRAAPEEGFFVIEGCFCSFAVLRRVHVLNSKWVARELSGRRNSKL
jgi:hypothetical protein